MLLKAFTIFQPRFEFAHIRRSGDSSAPDCVLHCVQDSGRRERIARVASFSTIVLLFGCSLSQTVRAQVAATDGSATTAAARAQPRDLTGMIARSAPSSRFEAVRPAIEVAQMPAVQPPVPAVDPIPRVIPLEPPQAPGSVAPSPPRPRVIRFPTDNTGLRPDARRSSAADGRRMR